MIASVMFLPMSGAQAAAYGKKGFWGLRTAAGYEKMVLTVPDDVGAKLRGWLAGRALGRRANRIRKGSQ